MALKLGDRVKENTTTTGTGNITLAGAETGFRRFTDVLSLNDTTYYAIVGGNQFEVGIGTLTTSNTLTRDTVLSSTNGNALVDFNAGTKSIFITQPSDRAVYQDASGDVADLDTDNVTEGSTNLYFTNERVDDRVGSLLVAGDNVTLSYDDAAGTLTISATEDNLSNNTTDDLAEGSTNLYYTSARANTDFDTRLATKDTDDVSEGATNLYYTDTRFDTRLATKDTDDVSEGATNLYYTDARADARVNLQTGANLDLSSKSTTDLSEGTNLYYTTARFDSAFSGKSTSDLTEGTNLYYTDTRFDTRLATKTTDNLTEGTNLYFTNERVDDRVSALVQNGTGISWSYNDVSGTLTPTISLSAFSTSDLSEGTNLYYTTARFDSAFTGKSTSDLSEGTNLYYTTARFDTAFGGKDTDDLTEGATNLYYTVARANSAIDARVTQSFVNALNVQAASVQANSVALGTDTTGNYVATISGTANKVSVTGSGSESAAVTLSLPDDVQIANDLTVAGDLVVNGATTTLGTTNLEVSDNLFELNSGLTTAPVNDSGMLIQRGTSDNAVFMWDESVDKFTLGTTTSDATVTGNITITTGSLVANLEGNVTGNVTGTVSSLSNHDTGDLAEGTNLYYTTARFDSAFSGKSTSDLSEGTNLYYTDTRFDTRLAAKSTSDLSEGTNLYYTAARFNSAFSGKSTSDLSEGTNLYYTDARSRAAISASGDISYNSSTGVISFTQSAAPVTSVNTLTGAVVLDTDDISEGTNLYYTNARVESYLDGGTSTPTFASATVSGNIAVSGTVDGRDVASDGSKLDGIESGATADQTAAEILTAIKTVDGSGSGLDADLLDGISSASFLRSDANDTYTGTLSLATNSSIRLSNQSGYGIETSDGFRVIDSVDAVLRIGDTGKHTTIRLHGGGNDDFRVFYGGADYEIWHSGNDGAGSGLDADLLDGVQGSSYLRSDATDTFTTLNGTQLNLGSQVQLRESTDRPDLLQITSSTSTWSGLQVRNSNNEGRWSFMTDGSLAGIYDDENGKWHIQMDENGETRLYSNATERIAATSVGADILGQLYVVSTTDEKLLLQGSSNPAIQFSEGTTNRAGIGWTAADDILYFHNRQDNSFAGGNFAFYSGDLDDPVSIRLAANDGDIYGYVYANHSNQIGFLDQDEHWAIRHHVDSHTEFRDNNETMFMIGQGGVSGTYGTVETRGTGKGTWAGYNINGWWAWMSNGTETAGLFNDTDNEWSLIVKRNAEVELFYNNVVRAETTNTGFKVVGNLENATDIYVDDQIISTGDTNTYTQFHAADQWRVVTGGTERLEVNNTATSVTNGFLRVGDSGSTLRFGDARLQIEGPSSGWGLGIDCNSNVSGNGCIGLSLEAGTTAKYIRFNVQGTDTGGSITANGTSSVSYNTGSDYRLKENITYDWDALDRLNQLKPARFNFITDPDTTVDGFIAHEVEDIVPNAINGIKDAVHENGDPDYQGMDSSKLVPLLVKAVQELSNKVEALEAQLQGN